MNWKAIQKTLSVDFAVFFNYDAPVLDNTIFYAIGYVGYGTLIIPKKGKPTLIVPEMELEKARKINVKVRVPKDSLEDMLSSTLKKKKVGLNYHALPLAYFKKMKKYLGKPRNISKEIKLIRKIKTSEEQKKIAKACKITEGIMQDVIGMLRTFKKEQEVVAYIHKRAIDLGVELAFPSIIASGASSSIPHYEPKGKMRKGFCIIDMGVKWEGYCADMTRTVYIGAPSKKELATYRLVQIAQKEAIVAAKAGVPIKKLTTMVDNIFGKEKKRFIHSLSHGIGLDIHEPPSINDNSERLASGMVITVEPGLYYQNRYGIRIEDTIAITGASAKNFMRMSTNLCLIKP